MKNFKGNKIFMVMYFLIIENFNCLKNLIVWLEDLPLQNYKEKKRTMTDQQYQPKGSQIDPEGLHDYMKQQIDKLKAELELKTDMAESLQKEVDIEHTRYLQEAIKRGDIQQELADLKEEVEEWKEVANEYHLETPSQLESWMSAAIHEDEEEYSKYMEPLELRDQVAKLKKKYELSLEQTDKLEEENKNLNKYLAETKIHLCFEEDMKELKAANKTLEDIHSGDMKIVKMLKEKWNEEQEKNKKLKEDITNHPDFAEIATDWYERHVWMVDKDEFEKLKEENKKLAEAAVVIDLSAMMHDPDYEGFDFESHIKKLKENLKLSENKKLQIPDEVKSCFKSLNSAWFGDESDWYSENYGEEYEGKYEEPEDIPTKHLQSCNYRDLRVLWDWLIDGKYEEYEEEESSSESDEEDPTDK